MSAHATFVNYFGARAALSGIRYNTGEPVQWKMVIDADGVKLRVENYQNVADSDMSALKAGLRMLGWEMME